MAKEMRGQQWLIKRKNIHIFSVMGGDFWGKTLHSVFFFSERIYLFNNLFFLFYFIILTFLFTLFMVLSGHCYDSCQLTLHWKLSHLECPYNEVRDLLVATLASILESVSFVQLT
jgi:hypothetical protein